MCGWSLEPPLSLHGTAHRLGGSRHAPPRRPISPRCEGGSARIGWFRRRPELPALGSTHHGSQLEPCRPHRPLFIADCLTAQIPNVRPDYRGQPSVFCISPRSLGACKRTARDRRLCSLELGKLSDGTTPIITVLVLRSGRRYRTRHRARTSTGGATSDFCTGRLRGPSNSGHLLSGPAGSGRGTKVRATATS